MLGFEVHKSKAPRTCPLPPSAGRELLPGEPVAALQMQKLSGVGGQTGPQHTGPGSPSTLVPSSVCTPWTVRAKGTRCPWFVLEVCYKIRIVQNVFLLLFLLFFCKVLKDFSWTLSHRPELPRGGRGVQASLGPEPTRAQPFLLRCQQRQLVPHVVGVCTVAAGAKGCQSGQHANWPGDTFVLGCELRGRSFRITA